MPIGIRNVFRKTADQVITSSAALVTIALGGAAGIPIAANQAIHVYYRIPFSVGATGGVRLQITSPAGATTYQNLVMLYNTVAPGLTTAFQASSAAFTNALANAGNHYFILDLYIQNGATAGTVDLQMAQNTSDALSLTVLRGAFAKVVLL
jgi:hypothetical protein